MVHHLFIHICTSGGNLYFLQGGTYSILNNNFNKFTKKISEIRLRMYIVHARLHSKFVPEGGAGVEKGCKSKGEGEAPY